MMNKIIPQKARIVLPKGFEKELHDSDGKYFCDPKWSHCFERGHKMSRCWQLQKDKEAKNELVAFLNVDSNCGAT